MAEPMTGRAARPHADLDAIDARALRATHPACRDWQERLTLEGRSPLGRVDVSKRQELAHKYGVAVVPTIVAVQPDGTVMERLAP
jgi:hypothetical protein